MQHFVGSICPKLDCLFSLEVFLMFSTLQCESILPPTSTSKHLLHLKVQDTVLPISIYMILRTVRRRIPSVPIRQKPKALKHVFMVMSLKISTILEVSHADLCQWRDFTLPHKDLSCWGNFLPWKKKELPSPAKNAPLNCSKPKPPLENSKLHAFFSLV